MKYQNYSLNFSCLVCVTLFVILNMSFSNGENYCQAGDIIELVAGGVDKTNEAKGIQLKAGDGHPAKETKIVQPFGVDFSKSGEIFFIEFTGGEKLRVILPDGRIKTLAGSGEKGYSGDHGPAKQATFNGLHGLICHSDGRIFLADTFNHVVRVYDPKSDKLLPFAGTGQKGFSGDQADALKADFNETYCIAMNHDFSILHILDLQNRRLRTVDMKTNIVKTVAGNGQKGVPKDGELAIYQPLVDPRAVAVDKNGQIYILERNGHALRVVDQKGQIYTVAGTGKAGQSETQMNGPKFLSVEPNEQQTVLIADTENHRILRFDPTNKEKRKLTLIAGTGEKGDSGLNGDPLKCQLNKPHGVIVQPTTGDLYISDSGNNRILKITKKN